MSGAALKLLDQDIDAVTAGTAPAGALEQDGARPPALSTSSRQHALPPGFRPSRFRAFGFPAAAILGLALSVAIVLRSEQIPTSTRFALRPGPSQPSVAEPPVVAINGTEDAAPASPEVATQQEVDDFAPEPLPARSRKTSSRTSKADRESTAAPLNPVLSPLPASLPAETPPEPLVQQAYRALLAGQTNSAIDDYRSVLARDARNCDALNGLGLIAARDGNSREAVRRFERCTAADPRNAYARSALVRLAADSAAQGSAERTLRETLRRTPTDPGAHFALGNELARSGHWAEAQEAYFQANTLDPGNPDYLFNLAVALDQLGHASLAREQYGLALDAAHLRPASFDRTAAATRRDLLVATQQ